MKRTMGCLTTHRLGWSLLVAGALGSTGAFAQPARDGAALFAQHCAACHQADGSGTVGLAPALKGVHWAALGGQRDYLPTVLLKGLSGRIKVGGQTFVGSMPTFAAQLDDDTLALIATHLATLQGAADRAAYTAADFAPLRQGPGDPAQTRQRRQQILGE
jgi:mono/diheme cytochrome c family protein